MYSKRKLASKKCKKKKRNAAGGAENIWFYSVQLGKSYNLLLMIMLVATCTTFLVEGRVIILNADFSYSVMMILYCTDELRKILGYL